MHESVVGSAHAVGGSTGGSAAGVEQADSSGVKATAQPPVVAAQLRPKSKRKRTNGRSFVVCMVLQNRGLIDWATRENKPERAPHPRPIARPLPRPLPHPRLRPIPLPLALAPPLPLPLPFGRLP